MTGQKDITNKTTSDLILTMITKFLRLTFGSSQVEKFKECQFVIEVIEVV